MDASDAVSNEAEDQGQCIRKRSLCHKTTINLLHKSHTRTHTQMCLYVCVQIIELYPNSNIKSTKLFYFTKPNVKF